MDAGLRRYFLALDAIFELGFPDVERDERRLSAAEMQQARETVAHLLDLRRVDRALYLQTLAQRLATEDANQALDAFILARVLEATTLPEDDDLAADRLARDGVREQLALWLDEQVQQGAADRDQHDVDTQDAADATWNDLLAARHDDLTQDREPLARARAATDDHLTALRRYLYAKILLPWIAYAAPCRITAVDRESQLCTVALEDGSGGTVDGVEYGGGTPRIGAATTLYVPGRTPPNPAVARARPVPGGRAWITLPLSPIELYYRPGTGEGTAYLYVAQWPPPSDGFPDTQPLWSGDDQFRLLFANGAQQEIWIPTTFRYAPPGHALDPATFDNPYRAVILPAWGTDAAHGTTADFLPAPVSVMGVDDSVNAQQSTWIGVRVVYALEVVINKDGPTTEEVPIARTYNVMIGRGDYTASSVQELDYQTFTNVYYKDTDTYQRVGGLYHVPPSQAEVFTVAEAEAGKGLAAGTTYAVWITLETTPPWGGVRFVETTHAEDPYPNVRPVTVIFHVSVNGGAATTLGWFVPAETWRPYEVSVGLGSGGDVIVWLNASQTGPPYDVVSLRAKGPWNGLGGWTEFAGEWRTVSRDGLNVIVQRNDLSYWFTTDAGDTWEPLPGLPLTGSAVTDQNDIDDMRFVTFE